MKVLAAAIAAAIAITAAAPLRAAEITVAAFGQPTAAANGFTLAPNAGDTASTLTMTNTVVDFTAFLVGSPVSAFMSLTANSVSAAASILGQDGQRFSGSFELCSTANCSGAGNINYISGVFTDAAFGTAGGIDLTVNVSDPSESLSLTSSVIPANELLTPNAFALSLVTGSAPLGILGSGATQTLGAAAGGPITYFVTGDVSASAAVVPEPGSLGLLAAGLLGLLAVRRSTSK